MVAKLSDNHFNHKIMSAVIAIAISVPLALIFILTGLPLFLKKVKRNYFFGFRVTRYAMLDQEIWYAVNRRGGQHLLIIGGLLTICAALSIIFRQSVAAQSSLLYADLAITVVGSLYAAISGQALNNHLAKVKGLRDHIDTKHAYKFEN